jgi:hypothetical protein
MHHHDDAGVVGQFLDFAFERLHVEELLHLRQHLRFAQAELRIAVHAEAVEHGDDRLAALAEFGDEARQIIFEKGLALRRKRSDD